MWHPVNASCTVYSICGRRFHTRMIFSKSCVLIVITSLTTSSFISSHTFSIRFMPGLLLGQSNRGIYCFRKFLQQVSTARAVWHRAPSLIQIYMVCHLVPKFSDLRHHHRLMLIGDAGDTSRWSSQGRA